MASPAAILDVMVRANTDSAERSLRTYNAALTRTDKRSVTATTRTTALGRASKSASGHLASAAKYAAGAAAAYISISQAKAAITTTQDLAKTTAGLNRNLGLTVKEGSRWAAVAKSRDIDAKSLTMSFTTLSRRVVDAGKAIKEGGGAAETAMAPFSRLGLSQQDVAKGSKDLASFLPRLADAFGEAEGGARRQASAQQLLGRGYATVLPLFAEGAKGLKEQQMWADKYGATLTNKTLKAQMALVQAQRESKVAWVGIQMTFAQALTPALEKANEQFQRIAEILADDRLSNTEKFRKIGKIIGGWADKALDAFVAVLPQIVSRAGEAAPKIAKAFVEGFINAPILGQLALGGWLMTKFGGRGGFSAVGSKAGQWFALAFIAAWEAKEVAKIISGEMLDATSREMKAADLEKIGYTAVQFIGKGMIAAFDPSGRFTIFRQKNGEWINKVIDDFKDWKQIPALALRNASDSFKNWDVWLQRIVDTGHGKSKKFLDTVGDHFKGVADDADSFSAKAWSKWDRFGDHLTGPGTRKVQTWRRSLADLFGSVPDMSDKDSGDAWKYWRDFGTNLNSEKGSGQVATFKSAVTRSFTRLANVSIGAISNLASETKKTLDGFGAQSSNVYVANSAGGGSGDGIKAQTGTIVPGIGNGDKVPAMLEPGEVVLNKKAVAAMGGAGRANSINSMIPRFASGGVVEQALGPYAIPPIAYDPNHAGGNSHLHLDFFTQQQAIAYGKKMQSMGWSVGEYSGPYGGFGPITTQHQSPGHYDGTAFDANTPADETRAEVAAVAKLLGSGVAGGAVAAIKQIKRVLLEGPAGPLTDMGQAALDKVRKAANAYISKQQPKVTSGASSFDPSGAAGALSRGQMRGLLGKVGLPDIMGWVAYAESGFNPSAHNASGASGLWQIMMPLHAAIVNGNVFDPLVNAQAAKTLYSQSGLTPWAASKYEGQGGGWAQHMGQAFASGGIAGKLAKIKGGGHYAGTGYTGPWASTIHGGGHKPPGPSHYTPNPYTGTASRPAAQLPKWLQDQIGGVGYVIAILEEQIDNAQTLAGFSSSEMGTALGPGEKAQQIGLYEGLLRKLVEGAGLIKQGLGTPFLDLEVQSTLSSALENIQGITGSGGRILQVRQALDELYAKNASASGMSISDLLGFSAAVMAGAFKTQPYMGAFAGGGVALVGEQGPELAHLPSGTRVHSAGDTREMMEPSVEVNFLGGGMEWLADYLEIKVNGVVQKIDKDKRRKALAGAR